MPDKLLHVIPWTDTEELRISRNEFKGKEYLAVRVWFRGRDDSTEYFPGKQGINVPLEKVNEFYIAMTHGIAILQGKLSPEKKITRKRGA